MNVYHSRCIDLADGAAKNEAKLQLWPLDLISHGNQKNRMWKAKRICQPNTPEYFAFTNVATNTAIDGRSYKNDAVLAHNFAENNAAQQWQCVPVGGSPVPIYRYYMSAFSKFCSSILTN